LKAFLKPTNLFILQAEWPSLTLLRYDEKKLPSVTLTAISHSMTVPSMRVIHDHSTLAIPTANPLLSSGFAYHPALIDLNISPGDWTLFTQATIRRSTNPDQTFLTVLSGVVTVCLIGEP
jgi:hypothetical protein